MDISKYDLFYNVENKYKIENIYEYFIPYHVTDKVKCIQSKNGIILLCNYLSWTRIQVIGDIDFNELSNIIGNNAVCIYYQVKDNCYKSYTSYNPNMIDFIFDDNIINLNKYDRRNHIKRKLQENVTIVENKHLSVNDYKNLFDRWVGDKTYIRNGTFAHHMRFLKSPGTKTFCCFKDNCLFAYEMYIKISGSYYAVFGVSDTTNFSEYTPISTSHLLRTCHKLHYFAGSSQLTPEVESLLAHKFNFCHGNFTAYNKIPIPKNSNKKDEYLKQIQNEMFVEENIIKENYKAKTLFNL